MRIIEAIILGIIQGLTEFLPISSSGHLVIFQQFFNIQEADVAFDVMLHLGTLIAVLIYYRKDVLELISEFILLIGSWIRGERPKLLEPDRPYRILMIMVILATIPTALIGLLFKDIFVKLFNHMNVVGYALIVTGILLWISNRFVGNRKKAENMTILDALTVGIVQSVAMIPGISRSGSTIFAGLFKGFTPEFAARFSFLLSIPAILGAVVLEGKDVLSSASTFHDFLSVASGFLAAAISGYIAIRILITLLNRKKFNYFAYYCWGVGAFIVIYTMFAA